ncbi:hypothetical protein L208DRAFT_1329313 [Tricholoma matsutake]|nr:hypothetical protein L208DRAFT_1329313 [Tricholoma matsutake 945]
MTGKIGTRAIEGHWVGYDDTSAAHRIYWPDKKSVGVERNVRFSVTYKATPHDKEVRLKGGDVELDEPTAPEDTLTPPIPTPASKPERCLSHTQKPLQYIRDIQSGKCSAKDLNNQPLMPHGIQIPEVTIEEVTEGKNVNDQGELMEEILGIVMTAKMAKAHGMEPRNLVEAKRSPDWPRCQEAMEVEKATLEKFRT